MALGVLNNLSAIYAENNLNNTNNSLQKVLQQLSSGSRINSGADDAAGLSAGEWPGSQLGGPDPVDHQRHGGCRAAPGCRWRPLAGDESAQSCHYAGYGSLQRHPQLHSGERRNQEYQSILAEIK